MQNLLFLSKMDEKNTKLPMEYFSLSDAINEIYKEFYEIIKRKNIFVKTEINSVNLNANKDSIINLISILLDNAVKYTGENGTIQIKLNSNGVLKITNSFIEKPADNPEKLFEIFYRGVEARTQANGGFGMGLSAAKAIAEANNALIKAEYIDKTHIQFTVKFIN